LRKAAGGMEYVYLDLYVKRCRWGLLFSKVLCHFFIKIKILAAVLKNASGYTYH
jgi:hypothetical protein